MRLSLLLALLPALAAAQTFPPDSGGGGGGGAPTFPLAAPCGTIDAPSYAIGNAEMGTWCTGVDGTLVIQNRDATPDTDGRSRLSLGVEFFSLHATKTGSTTVTGAFQCFDEGATPMICKINVVDTGSAEYRWLEAFSDSNRQMRGTGTDAGPAFGFVANPDMGLNRGLAATWGLDSMVLQTSDYSDFIGVFYQMAENEELSLQGVTNAAGDGSTFYMQIPLAGALWANFVANASNLTGAGSSVNVEGNAADSGEAFFRVTATEGSDIGEYDLDEDGQKLTMTGTQPTCAVGIRGKEWREEGAAGTGDTYQRCEKDANDNYAWRDASVREQPYESTWTDGSNFIIATITGTAAGDSGGGRAVYHAIALNAGGGSVQQAQECYFTYRNSSGGGVICSADPGDSSIRQSTGTISCDCNCLVSSSDVQIRMNCNTSGITEVSFDASGRLEVFGFEGVAPDVVYP